MSQFTIISAAMLAVGANAVQSFQDGTKEAAIAEATYDNLKRSFLAANQWNCNVSFFQLSREVAAPANKAWSYSYLPPPEWLSYIDIQDVSGNSVEFISEGGKILTNTTTAVAKYRVNLAEGDLPAWLETALVYWLAIHWAGPVSADSDTIAEVQALYKLNLGIAKLEDARNNPPIRLIHRNNSNWYRAHQGGRA